MKFFKFFLVTLCVSIFITACTSDVEINEVINDNLNNTNTINQSSAKKRFAEILSKAVYENEEMRSFIKEEALKQFDKDYDVFYPFIKDKIVDGENTFREILLHYCNEKDLTEIENSADRLNIFVPDYSMMNAFCADKWNIRDNEVAVAYIADDNKNVLYANGDSVANISRTIFPDFPMLIIKDNDKIKVVSSTYSNSNKVCKYDFIDDYFDNNKIDESIEVRNSTWTETPTQESTEPYISSTQLIVFFNNYSLQ